ncbi:ABC transporter permease [Xanthocytophaga flava]|uniref:ABC transporter permease n=1 Tax=Xanthocytophaga flava TaxID=3048013 RepID=UPI0028D1AC47|nr:ABC transporter permease [Xanthocytophaga flavus]MDJ1470531.1 ABC transporter permease [Xanthocytophaga flavus]
MQPSSSKQSSHLQCNPPLWMDRLLERFCAPHLLEEVQGDLHERYHLRVRKKGIRYANRLYFREVVSYLRPSVIRRRKTLQTLTTDMLQNYLIIAFRNLWRRKAFTFLNVFGLAIGIATALLIMLYVQHEFSYDRFNEKADQIVRVVFNANTHGEHIAESHVMPPTARVLKSDYPEVLDATRLRSGGSPLVSYKENTFKINGFAFADSNFFQVFTLPFLQGNPRTALLEPNSTVITKELAKRYFGTEDPIGKMLVFKELNATCKITGVIETIPTNSHFHFDLFVSMSSLPEAKSDSWMSSEFYTYLVLPNGYDYKKLESKLDYTVDKYMSPQMQVAMGMSTKEFRQKGNSIGLFLQPLTDIHLHSNFLYDLSPAGNIQYIYIFSAIALFMVLIACINFMNLSTAGAAKRAREVGMRKVLGSVKSELIGQFLLESILLTLFALGIAIGLVYLALPVFNQLAGRELSLHFVKTPWLLPGLLLFGILVGTIAGSYPAFFLSSFKPIQVLKGKLVTARESIGLRSGLVVFQFCVSISLMIGTTIVYQQLSYIQNKALGYEKDQVLIMRETWRLAKNEDVFYQKLLQDSRVSNASISGYIPAGNSYNNNFFITGEDNPNKMVKTLRYGVDYRYLATMGMKIIQGRNFSEQFATDSTAIILNETAARSFGWNNHAIGHTLTNSDNNGKKTAYHVIGIVQDFHFRSLHERISPLVMVLGQNRGTMLVKVKTKDVVGLVSSLKQQWTALGVEAPFEYSFLDTDFEAVYQAEQRIGQIVGIFSGLTIFVACLGLFGLAMFMAEQRKKEIGIRKVVGASVSDIVTLFAKDFLKLVALANLIAWPLVYYAMSLWLNDFAYHIDIAWWVFAFCGVSAILIALFTVSSQAIKAAHVNPVKTLRSE